MRHRLRSRIEALHLRLDQIIASSRFGESVDLRRLLAIHYAALSAVVPALERAGAHRLFLGWEGRSRLSALGADLGELNAYPPRGLHCELSFKVEQEVWGALYAVEGARLGNRVLLRRLAERGKPDERHATRFLAHVPDDSVAWPRLSSRLEALDYRGDRFEAAVLGATKVFDIYLTIATNPVRS